MSVGDLNVEYDPNNPYDQEDIQKAVSKTYQVTAKPVFSGCMKNGNKYYAYTQQGTKLDVSQSDCRNMIENGERPFNYFATSNPSNFSNSNAVMGSNVQIIEQPRRSEPTVANNVVEPHLQAQTINGANAL